MSRDVNGNYTLAAGNPVVTDTFIESAWANPTMNDLAVAMTDSLSRSGLGGMLVPFKNSDGTMLAPGMSWANEPTSGWYRKALNNFWYSVGNEDIFQITKAGIALAAGKTIGAIASLTVTGAINTATITASGLAMSASSRVTNLSGAGTRPVGADPSGNLAVFTPTPEFPSGTRMLFQQTAAPTGWTKEASATYNDAALRLVTGAAATGGADAFSVLFGTAKLTGSTILTAAQIPAHTHPVAYNNGATSVASSSASVGNTGSTVNTQANTGGGGGHDHTLSNFNLKFADCIIATKN